MAFLALVAASALLFSQGATADRYIDGTLYVDGKQSFTDETVVVSGNVQVNATGVLELENTTLVFNNSVDREFTLIVKSGGAFYLNSSTLRSVNPSLRTRDTVLYGTVECRDSTIKHFADFYLRKGVTFYANNTLFTEGGRMFRTSSNLGTVLVENSTINATSQSKNLWIYGDVVFRNVSFPSDQLSVQGDGKLIIQHFLRVHVNDTSDKSVDSAAIRLQATTVDRNTTTGADGWTDYLILPYCWINATETKYEGDYDIRASRYLREATATQNMSKSTTLYLSINLTSDPSMVTADINVPAVVNEGGTLNISASVRNTGYPVDVTVKISLDGSQLYSELHTIPAGSSEVYVDWDTNDKSAKTYTVKIDLLNPAQDWNLSNNSAEKEFRLNARPIVEEVEANEDQVLRTEIVNVTIKGEDLEDGFNLVPELQYQHIFGNWETQGVGVPGWDSAKENWWLNITVPKTAALGLYNISVRLNDTDGALSDWHTLSRVFEVKNNHPTVEDANITDPAAETNEDLVLVVNLTSFASDIEDANSTLHWYVEDYDDTVIRSYTGDHSATNIMRFTPVSHFNGETDVALVVYDKDGDVDRTTITLSWISVNDRPQIDNHTINTSMIYRGETVTFYLNGSELAPVQWDETAEKDMSVAMNYYLNDTVQGFMGWMDYDGTAGYFYYTADNWTKPDMLPLGLYSFNFTLSDEGTPTESVMAYLNDSLTVQNQLPVFVDLSVSDNELLRTQTAVIYVNASDYETDESDLVFGFQLRHVTLDVWNQTFLNVSGYHNGDGYWVFSFTPAQNATLGNYSFRVSFMDADGATTGWVYQNQTQVRVRNNLPVMDQTIGLSVIDMGLSDTVTLEFNASDVEDSVNLLRFSVEFNDTTGWSTSHFSDLGYNATSYKWTANFTPPLSAEVGMYSFRIMVTDLDGGVSVWLYDNDSLKVRNNVPALLNISLEKTPIYRTAGIFVYANGSGDRGTPLEESYFDVNFNVRYPDDSWFNFTQDDDEVFFSNDTGAWHFNFSTLTSYPLGNYTFRVRMKLNDSAWSNWLNLSQELVVMNNALIFQGFDFQEAPDDMVYRNKRFYMLVNASDLEDGNNQFTATLEYSSPTLDWTDLVLIYNLGSGTWNSSLFVPITAILEDYSFRTMVNDTDGSSTGWRYFNDSISILNNAPDIGVIPYPLKEVDEDKELVINLTAYESDTEDSESGDLTWTVVSYNTSHIANIVRRVNYDRFTFTPQANFSGWTNVTVRLTDSDGDTNDTNITLRWLAVNDEPAIYNAYFDSSVGLRGDIIQIFINGADAETAKKDVIVSGEYRILGDWLDSNITSYYYDANINRFVLNFTPDNYTPLGNYEFRVNLEDVEGEESDLFYLTGKLTLRNRPLILDLSTATEVAYEGDMIYFSFNATDREEDSELQLDNISMEFRLDALAWSSSNFSLPYYDNGAWHFNFTVPTLNATAYNTSFRVMVVDTDGDSSFYGYLGGSISLRKKPASIPDFHIEERYITVRGSRDEVYINEGEDVLFNITLQNRGHQDNATVYFTVIHVKDGEDNDPYYLGSKEINIAWWDFSSVTYLWDNTSNVPSGNYQVFVEVVCDNETYTDDNNATSGFLIHINARPIIEKFSVSAGTIYRNGTLRVEVEGEDSVDDMLWIELFYGPYGGTMVFNQSVSQHYWNGASGKNGSVLITIPVNASLGFYNLSVRLIDQDGGMSEFLSKSNLFRVMNNLPDIGAIPAVPSALEDNTITVNLSGLATDVETDHGDLSWYVDAIKWDVDYSPNGNTSVLTVSGEYGAEQNLSFTPVKDFFGWVNVTIVVEDADGGKNSSNITLHWLPQNDAPVVQNIQFSATQVLRGEGVWLYVNVSDAWGEELEEDLTVELYQYHNTSQWVTLNGAMAFNQGQKRFQLRFVPDTDTTLGLYSFNVTVNDENDTEGYLVRTQVVRVLNNDPVLEEVIYSSDSLYRDSTITIFLKSTDRDGPGDQLLELKVQYRPVGESEWKEDYLSNPDTSTLFGADYWGFDFTVPMNENTIGEYEFRASADDDDGGSSGWSFFWEMKSSYDAWSNDSWIPVKLDDLGVRMESSPQLADMDNDGDMDIVTGDRSGDISIWVNPGTPFQEWTIFTVGNSDSEEVRGLAVADLDGDGWLDIISGDRGSSATIYAWKNDGSPFDDVWDSNEVGTLTGARLTVLEIADLDDDGYLDIITGDEDDQLTIWQGDDTPFSDLWTGTLVWTADNAILSMVVVDLDDDGDMDIVTGDQSSRMRVWQNPYNNSAGDPFADRWHNTSVGIAGAHIVDMAAADLDDDGDMDIVTGNRHENAVYAWENPYDSGVGDPFDSDMDWNFVEVGMGQEIVIPVDVGDLDSDGDLDIISGDLNSQITLWENDGDPFDTSFPWQYDTSENVLPVAISADGEYIVAGAGDMVYLFSANSNTPLWSHDTDGGADAIWTVAISADGEYIVAGSADDKVYLFDKDSSSPLWETDMGDDVVSVSITANGNYLVAGALNGEIAYFGRGSSSSIWDFDIGDDPVRSVTISSSGEYIVVGSGGNDNTIYLFDKDVNFPEWTYQAGDDVWTTDISANGKYIVAGSGSDEGTLYLFDKDNSEPLWTYTEEDSLKVAISGNSNYLVVGTGSGKLMAFSRGANEPLWTYTGTESMHWVDIDESGDYLVAASLDDNVYLFDRDSSKPLWIFEADDEARGVSISGDGQHIAAGSYDNNVYSLQRGWTRCELPQMEDRAFNFLTADMDGDGDTDILSINSGDGSLYIWYSRNRTANTGKNISILNNLPGLESVSYPNNVTLGQTHTIFFDLVDVEDPESSFSKTNVMVEYALEGSANWESDYLDNKTRYYDTTAGKWRIDLVVPMDSDALGVYDLRFTITDNDAGTTISYRYQYINITHNIPAADNISASAPWVLRTDTLSIFANATGDFADSERNLTAWFQYNETNAAWEDFTQEAWYNGSVGFWQQNFTPAADFDLDTLGVRVNFREGKSNWSGWLELAYRVEVKNNIPTMNGSLAFNNTSIYRVVNYTTLFINATDVEDGEENLTLAVQYRSSTGGWTALGGVWHNDSAELFSTNFTPAATAELGKYSFRVHFTDLDGNNSGWYYFNDTLTVLNNAPVILEGDIPSPVATANEDNNLVFRLTNYESDIEDTDSADLSWTVVSYDSDAIDSYTRRVDYDQFSFVPVDNFYGDSDVVFRLTDKDGGYDEVTLTLHWEPVNDDPEVEDAQLGQDDVLRDEEMSIYISGSDLEDSEKDLTAIVQYQHEDSLSWWIEGVGSQRSLDPELVKRGEYDTADWTYGIEVAGDYVYLADQYNGLVIVDITDKTNPLKVGHYDTIGYAVGVVVVGNYAYVADSVNGLLIIDITNKGDPRQVGHYNTAGDATGVAVAGDYVYVADSSNGLVIIDITDKTDPWEVGHYDTDDDATDVAVAGDYAYLADHSNGLVIVDITDKTDPQEVGNYDTTSFTQGVVVAGDYAYMSDGFNGLVIVDITDKTDPKKIGEYNTAGNALDVVVTGNYAYVADYRHGLVTIDITDKTDPQEIAVYDTDGRAYSVAAEGDYAFVGDGENGLVVVEHLAGTIEVPFTMPTNRPTGNYTVRVRLQDTNDPAGLSDWYTIPETLRVWNNPPETVDIGFSDDHVYRDGELYIYLNATDIEDTEDLLDFNLQYSTPSNASWRTANLTAMGYDFGDDLYVFRYVPEVGAVLENLSFRAWVDDRDKNASGFVYDNGSVDILNNPPQILDLTDLDATELEDHVLTVNLSAYEKDRETPAGTGLNWYISDWNPEHIVDITGMNSTDDLISFTPAANFTGSTTVTFTLWDVDRGYSNQSWQLRWTSVNDAPIIENISMEENPIFIGTLMNMTVFVVDDDDSNSTLNSRLKAYIKHSTQDDSAWLNIDVIDPLARDFRLDDHTHFDLATNLSYLSGYYDIRINLTDSEGNTTSKLFPSAIRMVGRPVVDNFTAARVSVFRASSLRFYINGTDLEDHERDLRPHIEIYVDGEWNTSAYWNASFSAPFYNEAQGYWEIDFIPPKETTLGDYDFRVRFNDTFTWPTYSQWKYLAGTIKVENNDPVIRNIPPIFNGKEDHVLIVNLSNYEQDVEDGDAQLVWTVVDWDSDFLDWVNETDAALNRFSFTPLLDKENRTSVTFRLTDKDGGYDEVTVELYFLPVADNPRITDLEILSNWTRDRGQDGSLEFTRVDDEHGDYVTVPYDALYDTGDEITIAAWIKTSNSVGQTIATKVKYFSGDDSDECFTFSTGGGLALKVGGSSGTWHRARFETDIEDGQWHFVVGSYNGTHISVYVDGRLDNSTAFDQNYNTHTDSQLYIGASDYSSSGIRHPFDGFMDQLAIYDTGLNGNEIWSLYVDAMINPQPVVLYRFNETEDSNLGDSSGNGLDGTLNGGVWSTETRPTTVNIYNKRTTLLANATGYDPENTRVWFEYNWYFNSTTDDYDDDRLILDVAGDAVTTDFLALNQVHYQKDLSGGDPLELLLQRNMSILLKATPVTGKAPTHGNFSLARVIIQNTPPEVIKLDLKQEWQGFPQAEANITSTISISDYDIRDLDGDNIYEEEYSWYYAEKELSFQEIGSYLSGEAQDVVVQGDYAYVANGDDGLMIFDISNGEEPQLLGEYDTSGEAKGVAVSGNYAYVADDDNGLLIIDILDKADPQEIGDYDTWFSNANAVVVDGNYAYVTYGSRGMYVIDITDKTDPQRIDRFDTDGSASDVALSGDYVYVADGNNGLLIVNISGDRADPQLEGEYDASGTVLSVTVMDDHAYVTDSSDGLVIIDITDKTDPQLTGSYDGYGTPQGIAVAGNYAYLACDGFGLYIIDISDKTDPKPIDVYSSPSVPWDVAVVDDLVYLANWDSGLVVLEKTYTYDWISIPDATDPFLDLYDYATTNTGATYELLEKGMYVTLGVRASDDFYMEFGNETLGQPILIVNSPPVITVEVTSDYGPDDRMAFTNSNLTVSVVFNGYSDIDGDAAVVDDYLYTWYNNGVPITGETTNTLSQEHFTKDRVISAEVQAFDGTDYSLVAEDSISISNAKPSITETQIKNLTLDPAKLGGRLEAVDLGFDDIDGDAKGSFIYQWFRNSQSITGENGKTLDLVSHVDGGIFHKGDMIFVEVTPVDSEGLAGEAVQSYDIEILNTDPVIEDIVFEIVDPEFDDGFPRVDSIIIVNVTATDIDGDVLHFFYTWYGSDDDTIYGQYNIMDSNSPNNTFDPDRFSRYFKGANVSVQVQVSDSPAVNPDTPYYFYNVSVMSTDFIKDLQVWNTPPVMNRFTLVNLSVDNDDIVASQLNENSKLVVEVDRGSTDVTDADNDDYDVYCDWIVNGDTILSDIQLDLRSGTDDILYTELGPENFQKGDIISVRVWAEDRPEKEGDDNYLESEDITVMNTPPELVVKPVLEEPVGDIQRMSITIPGGQEAGFRDADPGDSLEDYYYKWYNGNNVVYQGWGNDGFDQIDNTLRIEGNPLFKKGDSIQVGVIPNDGEDNGSEILSGKVTIENRPPSTVGQPELRLFPEGAIPDKNSYVQVVGDITDPDDATQNLFFVVRWFKNGESISTGASPEESNYLPSSYFDRGDVITADYRPSDGVIEGDRGTASGSILVVNTVPVVSIDKPMDGGRYLLGDTVVFDAAGSYDLDLDALSFKWSINGEEVSTDTSFSYTFNTKGEMVVELEAQDGEGGVITKTITLQLRSPELTILSTEIIITGIQEKGEMITATVKIHNSGNTPVAQLPVTLQTGDGSFVKTKSVDISPGSFETLKFYWQPATDKQYTLSVEANPVIGANRSFVELDYADNTAQLTVTVHKGDTGTDGDDDKIWELWKLLGMTDVQFTVLLFLLLIIIYLVILFSRKNKAMKRFLIDRPVEERKEDEGDGEEEDQDDKEPNSSEEKDKEDNDLLKLAPPVPPLSTLESTDDEKEEDDTEDKGSEPLTKEEKKQQKKEEKQKGKEEKARKKEEEKQRKLEEKKKQKDGGKTDESGEKKEMNEASEGGIDLSELAKL